MLSKYKTTYRFLFHPKKDIRSRLELSSCFVLEEDYKKLGKSIKRLNRHC